MTKSIAEMSFTLGAEATHQLSVGPCCCITASAAGHSHHLHKLSQQRGPTPPQQMGMHCRAQRPGTLKLHAILDVLGARRLWRQAMQTQWARRGRLSKQALCSQTSTASMLFSSRASILILDALFILQQVSSHVRGMTWTRELQKCVWSALQCLDHCNL